MAIPYDNNECDLLSVNPELNVSVMFPLNDKRHVFHIIVISVILFLCD